MTTEKEEGLMPQYAVLVYQPAPADPMKISPEYEAALERYPAQVPG